MTQEIIPKKFDQSLWPELQAAADTWRLPYWDWAMQKPDWHNKTNGRRGPNVPEVVTLKSVPVRGRTGGMLFVDNPMWKFSLKPGDHMGNHGIPFLENEPVSGLHMQGVRASSEFSSSKPLKPPSGGPRLISPTTRVSKQSLWKERIRIMTPSLEVFVAITIVSPIPSRKLFTG